MPTQQIHRAEGPPGVRLARIAFVWLVFGASFLQASDAPPALFQFRLAISESVIGAEVNESDAKVAMLAWRDALAKQSGFLIDINVTPIGRLVREIRDHAVDGFTMTAIEFMQVQNYAGPSLVYEANGKGDEYLLLAHEDSGIRTLGDLRHKTINIHDNPKMCLAAMWLDTVISGFSAGSAREFFGRVTSQGKLSRVVLPVYFRQADACLVTKRGFGTMCELNPQLGRKLRVIAGSTNFVTSFMAFHKDLAPERRLKIQTTLASLHKTAAGLQALTLFETGQLAIVDSSILRSTLELVKAHEQLRLKKP